MSNTQTKKRKCGRPSPGRRTGGDPPAPANLPCPFLIGSVRPEVIVVSFKSHTGSTVKRWKLPTQISISEKY